MKEVSTIGLDLAKTVFQVHGVDGSGETVIRRQLRRGQVLPFFKKLPPCLVGMEACATSHHWAREITALGHEVRMMPARYVKPYVKRNKNDMADAEAICEAVTRPTMRFVALKTEEQQSRAMIFRARDLTGGMAFEAHEGIITAHAVTIIRDAYETASAGLYLYRDSGGAGIQRVFHQFLHHTGRPFHHFACGDLVGHLFRKKFDAVHGPHHPKVLLWCRRELVDNPFQRLTASSYIDRFRFFQRWS